MNFSGSAIRTWWPRDDGSTWITVEVLSGAVAELDLRS